MLVAPGSLCSTPLLDIVDNHREELTADVKADVDRKDKVGMGVEMGFFSNHMNSTVIRVITSIIAKETRSFQHYKVLGTV